MKQGAHAADDMASDYVTAMVLAMMWCNTLQMMALWPWLICGPK
jgi:hypothetical protein